MLALTPTTIAVAAALHGATAATNRPLVSWSFDEMTGPALAVKAAAARYDGRCPGLGDRFVDAVRLAGKGGLW
jgi:hypothetical protein